MIAVLALLAALDGAAAALPEAAPLSLDVQVTPEEITLGEHIQVRIAVEHDARDVYSLPGFDPSPLSVPAGLGTAQVHREELNGRARTTFTLVLADYGTSEPRLPDLTLHVTGPDGERVLTIRGRPLKFRSLVQEEGQGAPDKAHHGPKPPVPVLVPTLLWLWILLGVLAAAAAALVFRRLRSRRLQQAAEQPATVIEFDDEALERLASLRAEAPWKRGEGRAAIFRLSEIVRGYLGARLQFNALDLTSEELLTELRHRRLMGLDLAELTEELRWEDLVKFAKLEPAEEECRRSIDRAELLVRQTRPLRALQQGVAQQGVAA